MTASTTDDKRSFDFARLRERIDGALDGYTRFDKGCPGRLAEAIRYALLGPGKRLRPQLVLLAAEACGGSIDAAMPAACAVEMVHAYSLVHDDLPAMDDDDLRRGRPTCHKVFGEATAILAGDALLARAFEVLASGIRSPEVAARCCAVLGRAAGASALVGGQADDLDFEATDGSDISQIAFIHRRKTGAMFIAAVQLGGMVAGAREKDLDALELFAEGVGLAFQITDDLLDVSGSQSVVGKRVAKDGRRGKLTFPGALGVEESRRRAEELVSTACGMIEIFGPRAEPLGALARFVCTRTA